MRGAARHRGVADRPGRAEPQPAAARPSRAVRAPHAAGVPGRSRPRACQVGDRDAVERRGVRSVDGGPTDDDVAVPAVRLTRHDHLHAPITRPPQPQAVEPRGRLVRDDRAWWAGVQHRPDEILVDGAGTGRTSGSGTVATVVGRPAARAPPRVPVGPLLAGRRELQESASHPSRLARPDHPTKPPLAESRREQVAHPVRPTPGSGTHEPSVPARSPSAPTDVMARAWQPGTPSRTGRPQALATGAASARPPDSLSRRDQRVGSRRESECRTGSPGLGHGRGVRPRPPGGTAR